MVAIEPREIPILLENQFIHLSSQQRREPPENISTERALLNSAFAI